MCGFLFVQQPSSLPITLNEFQLALDAQKWRGPDSQSVIQLMNGTFFLGHNRLSIIDPLARSDQPMMSHDGRYVILYNGEIYNHLEIRSFLNLNFKTASDTETILEGYALIGEKIFELLDGMFALLILDTKSGHWVAARDALGIKPLYISKKNDGTIFLGSEPSVIAKLTGDSPCSIAVEEWRIIRRPLPGRSFFKNVNEILPGTVVRDDGRVVRFWNFPVSNKAYNQDDFESLLAETVRDHELSDVQNVSLLSGGMDSAVITALSKVSKSYCVGLPDNNEFDEAGETARILKRNLVTVKITPNLLKSNWEYLAKLRGEPLSVPNEGLIYEACRAMLPLEKVVLTGEGADELLFGYDGIYSQATSEPWRGARSFLTGYGYSDVMNVPDRLISYIEDLQEGKSHIEFMEDFFYQVHLPGLLRRMDFSCMAASKEARVPFVNKTLISYMYRRPSQLKIRSGKAKVPLRIMLEKLGLHSVLSRKKIGFSARVNVTNSRLQEYEEFQDVILKALKW